MVGTSFWRDLPREGQLLLSVVVLQFVGNGLVLPFWVVYLHELRGFSLATAGLLLGLRSLVGIATVVPAGVAIDRFGARVVSAVSLLALIVAEVVVAFASTVPLAVVGMALFGFGFGISFPASQSLVATVVPSEIRQRYFGVNYTLLNLGIGMGGVIGGLFVDVDRLWTFQTIYLLDAATFLPALFILLVPLRRVGGRAGSDPIADEPAPGYRDVLRIRGLRRLLVVTLLGSFVAYSQLNAGMPAYARAVAGVSTQGLGLAFAANTVVVVLLQLVVLGRIQGRRRTRVMTVMALVWTVSWSLLGLSGLVAGRWGATALVIACTSAFALGETLWQPTLPAIVNDLAPDRLRGRVNAMSAVALQVPMALGPAVAGGLIGAGLAWEFIVLLLVGCLAVAVLSVAWLEPHLDAAANGVSARSREPEPPVISRGPTLPETPDRDV